MIWEIAFSGPCKGFDAGAGLIPPGQAFGGRGISQSLSSHERVIHLGSQELLATIFVMGET